MVIKMRLMPRSFLARTILLIVVPLIVSLAIIADVFFDNHWDRVHETLARTLAGEVSTMMNFMRDGNDKALQTMAREIGVNVSVHDTLNRPKHNDNNTMVAGPLASQLKDRLKSDTNI